MATIIEMPKLSDTMTTGTVVKWLKNEGETVKSGDIIALVETDKATMDLEVFEDGVLLKIVAPVGAQVPCKGPIAVVGAKGESFEEALRQVATPLAEAAPVAVPNAPTTSSAPPASAPQAITPAPMPLVSTGRSKASPLAKKIAHEMGLSLDKLKGTGPGGRIVKRDVLAAPPANSGNGSGWGLHAAGPIAKDERIPMTNMRQTIARRLVESKSQIPHFYLTVEIDAAPLVELRTKLNETFAKAPKPFKLSLNDFVMKAAVEAIRKVPSVNASYEGDTVRQFGDVQLAFAVAIEGGLITPIIREAQNKNLPQISEETKALATRAKEGKLKPEDYIGGTFTISNLGMFGIDQFNAIINPPQAAILAVGNVVKKPVVDAKDQIVVGHRLTITLSCDHRVVDGAVAAQFMSELRRFIETPALLLI
jgi:pyruvate dehydrogenase E2 component (dihydrolipoamide acetyltransferase)